MARGWALRWMLFGSAAGFSASESGSQTLCDRMNAVTNRNLTVRKALAGLHLIVASGLRNDSIYNTRYLRRTRSGDGYEGFEVETLDMLAKMGNFTYEFKLYDRSPKEPWDTMLRRMAKETDLVTYSWWTITTERELAGLVSPYAFQDQSPVIVQLKPVADKTPFDKAFLQFAQPVAPAVWGIIVAATLCTAFLYWAIEHQDNPADAGGPMPRGILHATYLMVVMWTGAGAPNPVRPAGKLILAAWSITGLLVISAYTANLASFLMKKPLPPSPFEDVENMKSRGGRVCLDNTSAVGKWFMAEFPEVPTVNTDVFPSMFETMTAKGCEATVSAVMQSQIRINDPGVDDRCNLVNVGSQLATRGAGWVASLEYGPTSCKALIRDTLRHLFLDLEVSGKLKVLVDEHLLATKPCRNLAEPADKDSGQTLGVMASLDVLSLAGIFVVHAVMLASAALLDVTTRLWAWRHAPIGTSREVASATLTGGTVASATLTGGMATLTGGTVDSARLASCKNGKPFIETSVGENVTKLCGESQDTVDSLEHQLATLTKLCVENQDKVNSLKHQLATLSKLCVEHFAAVETSISRPVLPPEGLTRRKSSI